jgi:hypothetical protein
MMPGLGRIVGLLEELYPTIEARYLELKAEKTAAVAAAQAIV